MPLCTLENACLAYGHHALLDDAELVIEPGQRVGLIGRNGDGKSSLLKIIAGTAFLDDGTVWRAPGLRIGYVEQEPEFDHANSVFEEVSTGLGEVRKLVLDYHAVSHEISQHTADSEVLLQKLHDLQTALEVHDGWRVQARVETAIRRLGLAEDVLIGNLSGGQKKRVALARALVSQPDLLILDEPTNHLDFSAIEWLEELLINFSGTVLFVTHDRRFLDHVASRIVELDRGKLSNFSGKFSEYQRRKESMLEVEEVQTAKFDKLLAQEEAWIRKGIEARRTRNEGRVRRLESLRRERALRRDRVGKVNISLAEGDRSGQMIAELENVRKSFDERVIINGFFCRIMRGDKVGLLGPNGVGKSTLLKLILGELTPDSGWVRLGTRLSVAYFDQFREQLDPEATLVETISQGSDFIDIDGERKHVISYLGDFLFAPERARSPVKSLSGGERNRLLLARLFSRPANVLVLDEPTNDLDIETLELLESLLNEYSGTLFLVSHDRAFLDNVVTQVIAFEGNGVLMEYAGGYDDWVRGKVSREVANAVNRDAPGVASGITAPSRPTTKESSPSSSTSKEERTVTRTGSRQKLNYKESRELDGLPDRVRELEKEQVVISEKLGMASFYRERPEEVSELQSRYAQIEEELMLCLERWHELESRLG